MSAHVEALTKAEQYASSLCFNLVQIQANRDAPALLSLALIPLMARAATLHADLAAVLAAIAGPETPAQVIEAIRNAP